MEYFTDTAVLESGSAFAVQAPARTRIANKPGARWAFPLLLLFTVAVYARPEDIYPSLAAFHFPLVFGVCAGLAYLAALLSGNTSLRSSRELHIVVLLTFWYLLGVPFALWRGGSLRFFALVWMRTPFAFFLLTQTLVTLKRIRLLIWAIVLSECAVTAVTLIERQHARWEGDRLFGFNQGILGWNYFGIGLAMTVPYFAVLFLSRRSPLRTGLLAGACFSMMWMLMLTASRSGFLSVTLSIVLTYILILRHSARGRTMGAVLMLVLLVTLTCAPSIFWTRLGTLWSSSDVQINETAISAEQSTGGREILLKRSIQYTLDHPLLGVGIGNFPVASGTLMGRTYGWFTTHNTFTEISSEGGIPALLLFVALLTVVVRHMKRICKRLPSNRAETEIRLMAQATIVSVVTFAFGAFFVNLSYDYYFFYLAAIAVGLRVVDQRIRAVTPRHRLRTSPGCEAIAH